MNKLQFFDFKNNKWYYNLDFLRESRKLYKKDKKLFIQHFLKGILKYIKNLNRISLNAIEYWSHPYTDLILLPEDLRGNPYFHNLSEALTGDLDFLNVAKSLYDFFGQRQKILLINKPYRIYLVFNFDNRIKEMMSTPAYIEVIK